MIKPLLVTVTLLYATLGLPRPGEAGLIDFIWGLSGPQMVGFAYGCRYDFSLQPNVCEVGSPPGNASVTDGARQRAQERDTARFFFSIGGSAFVSTGKNSDTASYRFGDAFMVAFEPGLSTRTVNHGTSGLNVYHGVGLTYDLLFGHKFEAFDKAGVKITLVEVVYKHVAVGANVRLYPNGFTADEFGIGEREHRNRDSEHAWGVTFAWVH